jgi:shikimate kinase
MSVFLIGYRGCGKTTIGRKLADRLWQSFVDVDERIVTRAGKTIKAIFDEDGEPAFRELEAAVVRDCGQLKDHVIALGGGTLQRKENHQVVTRPGHKVVYLRCDPEVLLARIQSDPQSAATRPNLTILGSGGGGLEEIKAMLAIREPIYHSAMTSELDVTHLTPEEAVVYISRMI